MRFFAVPSVLLGMLVGLTLGASLACGPKVEQSHRHLARQWCEEWNAFRSECSPIAWDEELMAMMVDTCEDKGWWDRTDECGRLMWAWHECVQTLTCAEFLDNNTNGTPVCVEEADRLDSAPCDFSDNDGG